LHQGIRGGRYEVSIGGMREMNGKSGTGRVRPLLAAAALAASASAYAILSPAPAGAQDFAIPERVAIPTPRPGNVPALDYVAETDNTAVASIPAANKVTLALADQPVSSGRTADVSPVAGSLRSGLEALSKKDAGRALAIRAGLPAGSVERKTLAWAIALSGNPDIPSGEIAQIARDLPEWPGQKAMRANSERALARENPDARTVIAAFNSTAPESLDGAILLAKAYLATGNRKAANAAIAPIWREDRLSANEEKRVMASVAQALTREDHRHRMHMLFYRERSKDGLRMAGLAEQTSLAKAWAAVNADDKKAGALLDAVASASRKDAGYLYALVKYHRRNDRHKEAAAIMLRAPTDAASLVDPDEWWVERRIISRALLDAGDAKTAYTLAAKHSAESPAVQAEAEFHAGWYALRFLNNSQVAAKHFRNILTVSSTPISQARGYYWLARAQGPIAGRQSLQAAAKHGGTFYGQLAAQMLGMRKLSISNPNPGLQDKANFANREMVRAIALLEDAGYASRADLLYRELAERLNSPGELELLAIRAENRGNRPLALQVGKTAHQRGLEVDTVSWPIGAIPQSARIGDTGRALAYAIARQESAFNIAAVSPANAKGLLQLLPGTAKMMAKKTGLKYDAKKLTSDASYNATLGAAYLSEQLDTFGNSYILTFAGYNAGPGRVKQWLETYGDPRGRKIEDVVDWIERIPFTETRNYVQRVMENYQVYKARISSSALDIEDDLRLGRR
jgi:soluble lytic murein transglycosylase